jgi:uncharacterized membrane protein
MNCQRIQMVDLLRGVVMIVMALAPVRDFSLGAMAGPPSNLTTTTPERFLARWITHFLRPAVSAAGWRTLMGLVSSPRPFIFR